MKETKAQEITRTTGENEILKSFIEVLENWKASGMTLDNAIDTLKRGVK